MRPPLLALLVPLALAGATTPAGPVGRPLDLRPALPEDVAAGLPIEPSLHKKVVPIGKDGAGEAELSWGTARVGEGAWVTDVSLAVTRPAEGYEVLEPVVLPPVNRGTDAAPVASVGVVVGWRKESACRSEMSSVTFQIDGKGEFTAL
jgi:hypothetical protein